MTGLILDHLWQSTLFTLAAGLLTLAFARNRAGVRYAIWFAASLKFLIPFTLIARAASAAMSALAPDVTAPALAPVQVVVEPFSSALPLTVLPAAAAPAAGLSVPLMAVITLWAAGLIAIVTIWAVRWVRLRLLLRTARPSPVEAPVPVKSSSGFVEPGLFGVVKPVILLPEGIERVLSPEEMQAVIDHEVCHLKRRDNLTAAIHMAVQALFWFHPLVWWIGERLVAEREAACDEAVLEGGADPKTYADGILKVCRHYLDGPLPCVAGIAGGELTSRVRAIMDGRITTRLNAPKRLLLAAVGALAFAAPLGLGMAASPLPVLAQAPASALGAPAQAKVADSPADSTVSAGKRKGDDALSAKLASAIASGDVKAALEAGASAADIVTMMQAKGGPSIWTEMDPSHAGFVRDPRGNFAIGYAEGRNYFQVLPVDFAGYVPSGGLSGLPTLAERFGDPPVWPERVRAGQMVMNGASAQSVAVVMSDAPPVLGASAMPGLTPTYDLSSARFVRGPDGVVAVTAITTEGGLGYLGELPGTESYPGLQSLPTFEDVRNRPQGRAPTGSAGPLGAGRP